MFPDNILLARMEERAVYSDEKSHEGKTGKIKRKYKLFCSKLLNIYIFLISESHHGNCRLDVTLWVREEEWLDRNPNYLKGISYFDLGKSEHLTEEEVLHKTKELGNGLPRVAYLPDSKHKNLQDLLRSSRKGDFAYREVKIPYLLKAILKKEDLVEEKLKQLGI